MAARQTISYLAQRFGQTGFRLSDRQGQNFLIDLNLLRLIVEAAELEPRDVVLEVGTGTGSLTALVAERAAHVVSVEIDSQLHQLASEELLGVQNVTLLRQDALRGKHELDSRVLEAVHAELAKSPERVFKLVANLPYNVATPVIGNLLALDRPPRSMTVTIQKELGDRLLASPCSKDYSALSVWVQSQCTGTLVRVLPPTVFWPRPKVHSAIVHLELDDERRDRIANRDAFHQFVRALFCHRRKVLRGVLPGIAPQLDKPQADALLAELGFTPRTRAEELAVDDLLRLHTAVLARGGRS